MTGGGPWLLTVGASVALGACVSWDPAPQDDQQEAASPSVGVTGPSRSTLAPPPSPAAAHLLSAARNDAAAGNLAAASAGIERALRIDPGNPWLLVELAKIRLREGRAGQSDTLAEQARMRAPGDVTLQRAAWRASAAARGALGDGAGAEYARRQADALGFE